jgi:VWFA-related protein
MNALLLLSTLASAVPAQDYAFRVDVSRVYVDVFVTRRGEVVSDLDASRFRVYDDGVLQSVELVDAADVPKSFLLLLDESGSIDGRRRELLEGAVRDFASRLSDDDELAVLTFAERTRLRRPLELVRVGVARERDPFRIESGGWTALNDALLLSMIYLRGARGRPLLVAFTDGIDNASWIVEEALLSSARATEAVVFAVKAGVTIDAPVKGPIAPGGSSGRSAAMLDELTRRTGGRTLEAGRTEAVGEAFRRILSDVETRYVLAFTPGPGAAPGWHELRVTVEGVRDVEVRARQGYFMTTP